MRSMPRNSNTNKLPGRGGYRERFGEGALTAENRDDVYRGSLNNCTQSASGVASRMFSTTMSRTKMAEYISNSSTTNSKDELVKNKDSRVMIMENGERPPTRSVEMEDLETGNGGEQQQTGTARHLRKSNSSTSSSERNIEVTTNVTIQYSKVQDGSQPGTKTWAVM